MYHDDFTLLSNFPWKIHREALPGKNYLSNLFPISLCRKEILSFPQLWSCFNHIYKHHTYVCTYTVSLRLFSFRNYFHSDSFLVYEKVHQISMWSLLPVNILRMWSIPSCCLIIVSVYRVTGTFGKVDNLFMEKMERKEWFLNFFVAVVYP